MTADANAEAVLHAHGYRNTAARQLVLDAVRILRHATPEQVLAHVHHQAPGVNLSTVYRVLAVLSEVGLVRHAHIGSGSPVYHATDAPAHLHFSCDSCGLVQSLPAEAAAGFSTEVRRLIGFEADLTHAGIHGRCAACAARVDT
jgi:Fur family ferric uptake transcriptional regulator